MSFLGSNNSAFDKDRKHTIPLSYGAIGIAYRKSKFSEPPSTWRWLLDSDKYAGKIATGSPMSTSLGGRYFHKEDWWDKALMKDIGAGIERNVGCIVEAEDGSWGFGFSDRGRITAAIIDDYLAPNLIGRSIFETEKLKH